MKKVELRIIGLSYSQTQVGSYVLVLGKKKGNTRLPIIIKPLDAQYISMKIEDIKTSRPLTQDLIRSITDSLGADLQQVVITNVIEGIFYAKMIFSNIDEFEIECSVGDAISQALSYGWPIFCNKEVLNICGIEMSDDGTVTEEQYKENHKERDYNGGVTVENLENMLQKAIENEEYEIASQLRDRINEIKDEE